MGAKEAWAAKAERLEAWAAKADAAASAIFASQPAYARDPAFQTQPARSSRGVAKARARLNDREVRAWELQAKAKAHREKAAELRRMASTNAGDAEARKTAYRAALDSIIEPGMYVDCIYGVRRVEKVNTKSLRLAGALGPVTIDKTLCKIVPERCGTCADWKGGECWSGDRLDGDLSNGSAGVTLPSQVCEAWRP
ncbi:hypothetical protein [Caulobacter sp. FWC2]|uniref:hypothetical protein n=1 Tax=Caulobacter sp. FWC2 TaxID=69664 RepID=UPI000C15F5A7|nr:hypothetical protein [Caulobacter sp. FWC2]PIB91314.1 hypothetical protein CSW62_06815 [Caulobacter sp. FWC2]